MPPAPAECSVSNLAAEPSFQRSLGRVVLFDGSDAGLDGEFDDLFAIGIGQVRCVGAGIPEKSLAKAAHEKRCGAGVAPAGFLNQFGFQITVLVEESEGVTYVSKPNIADAGTREPN